MLARLRTVLLALVPAMAAPAPAFACSLSDWNSYESHWKGDLSQLVREAATIDWVDIAITNARRCPSWADKEAMGRDAFYATVEPDCDWSNLPKAGIFKAEVVERLKGASPASFDLFMMTERYVDYRGVVYPPERFGFSDLQSLPPYLVHDFRRGEVMTAAGGHRSLAFWSRGVSQFQLDGGDSCGGRRSLDPSQRYIAFRDRAGVVTALEPVAREDDLLLERLRRLRDGALSDIRSELTVEDYFRRTSNLVLARVSLCLDSDYYERELGWLVIDRGDPAFLEEDRPKDAPPREVFSFSELADFFVFRKEPCPVGRRILVLSLDTAEYDPIYQLHMIAEGLPVIVARMAGLHDYTTLMTSYDYAPSLPVRVTDGNRVKLSDIQTGFKLIGPESVSVDDIFRWHEEGRAKRKWR